MREEVEGEQLHLRDRVSPVVPPPGDIGPGWLAIDRLGAWDSFLCRFPMLEEVPEQHKGAWAAAWGEVLTRWEQAESEIETTRALMWLGFLTQALLRKPTRGGRAGRREVSKRFLCINQGDWGSLVTFWLKDTVHYAKFMETRRRRRTRQEQEKQNISLRKKVLSFIHRGQVSKAANRISSHGLANHADPIIQQQLKAKFPSRKKILPMSTLKISPIDDFDDLRGTLLSLPVAVAPGSGGLRNEFLVALGERMEDHEMKLLERFGMAYIRAELPTWFNRVWLTVQTVPIYKTQEKTDVRPLGLRNSLVKVFHRQVMSQCKNEI